MASNFTGLSTTAGSCWVLRWHRGIPRTVNLFGSWRQACRVYLSRDVWWFIGTRPAVDNSHPQADEKQVDVGIWQTPLEKADAYWACHQSVEAWLSVRTHSASVCYQRFRAYCIRFDRLYISREAAFFEPRKLSGVQRSDRTDLLNF